uniref:U3 small nucleolar RNA-associated protein 18 homolog n=1 Tax=Kalanchoe fedtschenkoi TaxID=63787 RepID=A0A7N0T3H8_KALFE
MSLISQNGGAKLRLTEDGKEEEEVKNGGVGKGSLVAVKKKRKRERRETDEMEIQREKEEVSKLEDALFGSIHSQIRFGNVDVGEDDEGRGEDDSTLFFSDRSANSVMSVYEEDGVLDLVDEAGRGKERKPVWEDEEEKQVPVNIAKVNRVRKLRKEEGESVIDGAEYVARLRAQHVKLNPGTEWAKLDSKPHSCSSGDEGSDEEKGAMVAREYRDVVEFDDILRSNEDLVTKSSVKLLPGLLEYSRMVDANVEDPSSGPICSVQFHRNGQLLLAAGLDRRLRFFQIDGKRNTKIQSIFIDDCPVRKASFLPDGSQVIISGRRKFFYSFDLVKAKVDKIGPLVGREEKSLESFEISPDSSTIAFIGNEGYILLVSTKTKELIGTLKMNGTARSLAFADNGRHLLSSGGDGHVYHWDLRTRTCFHKGVDEGCLTGTALCTSPVGNMFAAGSDSGIVNVYNRDEFIGGKKKPLKTIENLTTRVNFMEFNNDAQILAVCSSMKKNSLKLVHVPSFTVFSNWPPTNRSLGYPTSLDFSPGGGFMAFGNAAGKVMLYKLHHYQHA